MKRIAKKTCSPESTRDICKILVITVVIFLSTFIKITSFIVLAILRSLKVDPFGHGLEQREAWTAVFITVVNFFLFISYLMLIKVFWNYVINVNKHLRRIHKFKAYKKEAKEKMAKTLEKLHVVKGSESHINNSGSYSDRISTVEDVDDDCRDTISGSKLIERTIRFNTESSVQLPGSREIENITCLKESDEKGSTESEGDDNNI